MSDRARLLAGSAAVFVAACALYSATFNFRTISDTELNSLQTRALVLHGDVDVSRYQVPKAAFAFEHKGGLYSIYGVGVSVVSAPAYLVLTQFGASDRVLQAAAVIPFAALALLAMWRLLLRLAPGPIAAAGTIVFGFGTPMWPLATMALYQHASVALFHVLGIHGFLDTEGRRGPALAGLGFGAAAFVRTPAAVPLIAAGLYYLIRDRRSAVLYAMGAAAPVAGILIQNRWIWGTWATGGYSLAGIGFNGSVSSGVWGLLFGWWRGLFVYSPALILGAAGFILTLVRRRSALETRLAVLGASVVASIGLYARWSTWHGGLNQFGFRYLLDVVPFLVVLGVYAAVRLPRLRSTGLGLGVLSVITMTFGAAPNRFSWDGKFFATRFVDGSLGQAWIAAFDRPLQSFLRLAGVAVVAFVVYRLSVAEPASGRVEGGPSILHA